MVSAFVLLYNHSWSLKLLITLFMDIFIIILKYDNNGTTYYLVLPYSYPSLAVE